MKKNLKFHIYEVLIFIIGITLKLIINSYFPILNLYYDALFFTILAISVYASFGFYRDGNYLKKLSIKYCVIGLLSYFFISYFLGMFAGYTYTTFSKDLISILKNITPVIIFIISKELIRYILLNKFKKDNTIAYTLTLFYILYQFITLLSVYNLNSFEETFIFFSNTIIPIIARECLYTYIAKNISLIPNIVLEIALESVIYILPIYPNLGNYLNSIMGLLLPSLIFFKLRSLKKYDNIDNYKRNKESGLKYFVIPIIIVFSCLIILISGIFKYHLIAIGSDSMNPIYYRGDGVIYEKTNANEIQKNDILVFKINNIVITHRVTKIIQKNEILYFETKGDNNKEKDDFLVSENNVLGKVKYVVKYIGYPTIWINEKIK